MTTMYILATDEFDNGRVVAVYSSYELVKEAQTLWDGSQIESVSVDTMPDHPPGTVGWHVTLQKREGAVSVFRVDRFNPLWVRSIEDGREFFAVNGDSEFVISCWAASKDEAIEIARHEYDDFQARKMVPS